MADNTHEHGTTADQLRNLAERLEMRQQQIELHENKAKQHQAAAKAHLATATSLSFAAAHAIASKTCKDQGRQAEAEEHWLAAATIGRSNAAKLSTEMAFGMGVSLMYMSMMPVEACKFDVNELGSHEPEFWRQTEERAAALLAMGGEERKESFEKMVAAEGDQTA
ncbi:uncharacterized protein LTR77_004917 [Saxophila tyrrhenica]|uniref:Uncharacterized protein n=1 Tax=Saxophila tyrrhenica TaxID=1690608 RepID=A0AAV9PDP4_9PEZI|nr:hypothetical protein LTR77_004917 [Saxophila tyrrhenica]